MTYISQNFVDTQISLMLDTTMKGLSDYALLAMIANG